MHKITHKHKKKHWLHKKRHQWVQSLGALLLIIAVGATSATLIIRQYKATIVVPEDIIFLPVQMSDMTEIISGDTGKQQVIFTFDGGSGADSAEKILEVLVKHHVTGTFFLTGKFVENYPDLVRKMRDGGHEIFNHTATHPYLTQISDDAIVSELTGMDSKLQTVAGVSSKPFFRPPYGDRDSRVLDVAKRAGYRSVFWTTDALDWRESEGMTPDAVKVRILSQLRPGALYLMHIGDTITGSILDEVFTEIKSRGYKIVSLVQGI